MREKILSNFKTNIKGELYIIVLTTTKYTEYMFNKICLITIIATAGFLQDTKG